MPDRCAGIAGQGQSARQEYEWLWRVAPRSVPTTAAPDLYWTMVLGRGWTERQLSNWTARVVLDDLFGVAPARNP